MLRRLLPRSEKTEIYKIYLYLIIYIKMTKVSCVVCKKKLSIVTEHTCKCDSTKKFCALHRYPEEHKCTAPIEKIVLDKIIAQKIDKI